MSNQSVVAEWNEVMLEAIRAGGASPTSTTYQLYLVSSAVYEAWSAYDEQAFGQYSDLSRPAAEATEANKAEAVSHAAYAMLSAMFPAEQARFDAFMDGLGYDKTNTSTDPSTPAGLGNAAAQAVQQERLNDGSNAANGFADTTGYSPVNSADPAAPNAPQGLDFDPNHWQPLRVPNGTLTDANGVPIADNDDPSTYTDQQALTPHWGSVTPFALESGDQFRPAPPPEWGSDALYEDGLGNVSTAHTAYVTQVNEVMQASANLTTEHKVIAEFWADGPRTESPPGHWNQIAQDIALREGHGIDEDAKLFLALNAAIFDAGIATWEAKYAYDFVRPQSAIRFLYQDQEIQSWGGPDQGTQTILGQEWQPYQNVTFVTPPFPEFVSGHSTFSMAAANTIAAFVGSDAFYDGTSLSNYDLDNVVGTDLLGQYVATELSFETFPNEDPVILQWDTLTEAAQEAGVSRIYGGIHIQDGNLRGLEVGSHVADQAETLWSTLFSRGGDDVIRLAPGGGTEFAGPGNDRMFGSHGFDTMRGGSGDDTMFGYRRGDLMEGGDGADLIRGGRGRDTIDGGAGDDTVIGGRGADTIILNTHSTDTVQRFDDQDVLIVEDVLDPTSLSIAPLGQGVVISVDGTQVAILPESWAAEVIPGVNLILEETPIV